ncbi:MAG: DUF4340 domain-containing protein [Desulfobulbus sp.]|nr:DUF4340 domain-containing protein [Desulfobulbus sp.]
MKRWILVCALLVLVQVGATVWTNWGQPQSGTLAAKGPLLALQAASINGLLLEDFAGQKLALEKRNEHWVLPGADKFSADAVRIQGLIDKLVGLQRGWPEAATSEAATRFKVAPENFAHRLTVLENGKAVKVIYFGSSPGLRALYLRVDKDPEIYSMTIAANDLAAKEGDWIDTTVLHLKADQVVRVQLPGLELEQGKAGLQPVGLKEGEELVKEQRDLLVNRLTGLSISALLGKEVRPEYGLDHPVLAYSVVLKDGTTISYQFGQKPKSAQAQEKTPSVIDNSYVLKVSNQEQLLQVDGWQVDELKKASRGELVQTKVATTPAPKAAEVQPASAPAIPPQPQPSAEALAPPSDR